MTERVKCVECENMILPDTAARHGGLCARCAKIPAEQRAAMRAHEARVASGLVLMPSEEELSSASTPLELLTAQWLLQPEYYAERNAGTVMNVIEQAKSTLRGNVFLVTASGCQFNLGYTHDYAVCEFQNPETGEFRYAYSASNLRQQVSHEDHVVQTCPCSGVGLLWYPSRYHMVRATAFAILEHIVNHGEGPPVRWLAMSEDISFTRPGRG